jgi:hypothetical protein
LNALGTGLIFYVMVRLLPNGWIEIPPAAYLPLHTLLETGSIVLASGACWLLWQSPSVARNLGQMLLAACLAGAALLDFCHAMSYQGMPPLVTPAGPEKAIAFWLLARLLTIIGMAGMVLDSGRPPSSVWRQYAAMGCVGTVSAAGCWLVLLH